MQKLKVILLGGLKVLAPFVVTVLLLYWVFIGLENLFRLFLLFFIDDTDYFVGLGWIAAIFLTVMFGILVQIPLFHKVTEFVKAQLIKLPVIKTLYRMSSDITMFLTKKGMKRGEVVKIITPIGNLVGILTQERLYELAEGIGTKDEVAVYIPMSYQIGGYTLIVPKESIEPLEISVQDGIALTMTAFISGKNEKKK